LGWRREEKREEEAGKDKTGKVRLARELVVSGQERIRIATKCQAER
jgi:hypothetical protein